MRYRTLLVVLRLKENWQIQESEKKKKKGIPQCFRIKGRGGGGEKLRIQLRKQTTTCLTLVLSADIPINFALLIQSLSPYFCVNHTTANIRKPRNTEAMFCHKSLYVSITLFRKYLHSKLSRLLPQRKAIQTFPSFQASTTLTRCSF